MFRKNAIEAQGALNGRVRIAPPPSWKATNIFLASIVIIAIIFISLSNYTKTVNVSGYVDKSLGSPEIIAPIDGYININKKEGDNVKEDDLIITIESKITSDNGLISENRKIENDAEIESAKIRSNAAIASGEAIRNAAQSRINASEQRLNSYQNQLYQAKEQTQRVQSDLNRAYEIAKKGFISQRDLEIKETQLSVSIEKEEQIKSEIAQIKGDIEEAKANSIQALSDAKIIASSASTDIARAKQTSLQNENIDKILIKSPINGKIALLPIENGKRVKAGDSLAIITRPNDNNIAKLEIPAANLSNINIGQNVKISLDAYPYQTYGTINGKIISVTSAARTTDKGPVFDVKVTMPKYIKAYGKKIELLPGLTVNARIETKKRTLLQWLFDPILAVKER